MLVYLTTEGTEVFTENTEHKEFIKGGNVVLTMVNLSNHSKLYRSSTDYP
jgi:hypothetical protein